MIAATGLAAVLTAATTGLGLSGDSVATEQELQSAFADPDVTTIVVAADIILTCAGGGGLSRDGAVDLRFDGGGHTISQSCENNRIMTVTGTGALVIENVRLTGGSCDGDGGAAFVEGDVSVIDTTAYGNTAGRQGGAFFVQGDVSAVGSELYDNNAGRGGGAIAARGDISVEQSHLHGNVADHVQFGSTGDGCQPRLTQLPYAADGGAIRGWRDVDIIDTDLETNSASRYGGAIFGQQDVNVSGSTLRGNSADGAGGAIRGFRSVTLTDSDAVGNVTASSGGAVHASAGLVATGTSFADNSAQGTGGAILVSGGAELTGVTISGNRASRAGGGVAMVAPGDLVLRGSTVEENRAPEDGDVALRPGIELEVLDSVIGNRASGQPDHSMVVMITALSAVLIIGAAALAGWRRGRSSLDESDGRIDSR